MRFFVLVAAAAVTGAVSVVSFKTLFPQQHAAVVTAVRTAGDSALQFRLSDLNPIRRNYDSVISQVTSPSAKFEFPSSPPVVGVDPGKLIGSNQLTFGGGLSTRSSAMPQWHGPSRSMTTR